MLVYTLKRFRYINILQSSNAKNYKWKDYCYITLPLLQSIMTYKLHDHGVKHVIMKLLIIWGGSQMNSKQLLFRAFRNQEVERIPWVPFVGCHGASLLSVSSEEYFKSSDLMFAGFEKALELYRPDGLPAMFDLQVEAEAIGCKLRYADTTPPSVETHILENGKKLTDLKVPGEKDGRFPIILDALRKMSSKYGDAIGIYGLVTGPFTLALHLRGTDIFYDIYDEPKELHSLMRFCTDVAIATSKMYLDAGAHIIAVVDPMTSQIIPEVFAEFVGPYCAEIFEYVKQQGKLSSFFVCGDAKRNVEEMCKCKPDNVSIDENIPLDYVREICQRFGISFGGNIKLTMTILFGTPADNIKDAQNCMSIGGNKGFILAPGCDIPFDSPVQNLKAITSAVHGEIASILEETNILEGVEFSLPDYKNEKEVVVDVITLDSDSCAPCFYMVQAVAEAAEMFGDKIKYVEHKVRDKESVVCMLKLGVSNIPTICVDGIIKYISVIPPKGELQDVFRRAVEMKAKNQNG
jgi:MtaA/CmuA family methyltransferase